jgi:hypothetical protein
MTRGFWTLKVVTGLIGQLNFTAVDTFLEVPLYPRAFAGQPPGDILFTGE